VLAPLLTRLLRTDGVLAGADVDYIDPVFCWTALHIASLDGKSDAVDTLLRAGANPDIANDGGNTAIHMASRNGQVRCVQLLCDAGADLAIVNEAGQLARQEAAERVTRQFRYNGTSHQGVLEAIDKELARRESHALCAALQRLAFAATMHERLGSTSALQARPLPRRPADGCWELMELVIPPNLPALAAAEVGTTRRAESEGWAWRDHQASSTPRRAGYRRAPASPLAPTPAPAPAPAAARASAEEAEAEAEAEGAQRDLPGQLGKVMGGQWVPTGSALHDAVNIGSLSAVRAELAAVRAALPHTATATATPT